jgi:V-type H+-transporting ATPase subunit F
MLLAGIGNVDSHQRRNYLIVDNSKIYNTNTIHNHAIIVLFFIETSVETIEECFKDFTTRRDIAIVLINQHVLYL